MDSVKDISDNAKVAYDVKRNDIEDNHIPQFAKTVLTNEEIRRSEHIGLAIGTAIVLFVLFVVVWYIGLTNGWWTL